MPEQVRAYNYIEDGSLDWEQQAEAFYNATYQYTSGVAFLTYKVKYTNGGKQKSYMPTKVTTTCDEDGATSQFLSSLAEIKDRYDCYASVNTFSGRTKLNKKGKTIVSREAADCVKINGVVVDYDILHKEEIYDRERGDEILSKVKQAMENLYENGFPRPTISMLSGRGRQDLYIFREPINVQEDPVACMKYRALFEVLTDVIQSGFNKDEVDIDTSVGDASRICRVPGTYNVKGQRYAALQEINPDYYYTLNELCEYFGVTIEEAPIKEKQEKKQQFIDSTDKIVVTVGKLRKLNYDEIGYMAIPEDKIPELSATNRANAKGVLRVLKSLAEYRGMSEGDLREEVTFWYYNYARQLNTASVAAKMTRELNESFSEPLEEDEVTNIIDGVNRHRGGMNYDGGCFPDGFYYCKRETLYKKTHMTEEEKKYTQIFKRREEKEQQAKNVANTQVLKEQAYKMWLGGAKKNAIARALGKDRSTITDWIKKRLAADAKVGDFSEDNLEDDVCVFSPSDKITTQEEPTPVYDEPTLNAEQQLALEDALRGNNLVISGNGGGVGKSLLIRKIVEALEERGKTVAVTAATALAAENIDGITLHRAMKMYFDEDGIVTSNMVYNAKQYNTIVIDEASMIGSKTFEFFCKIREEVRRRYNKYIQVILVCDILQLPPVNDRYFFQTECFINLQCNLHYLRENYRQNGDTTYLNLINKVRIGEDRTYVACELNRICNHSEDARYTYLTSRKSDAFVLNQRHLNNLEGDLIDLGNVSVKIGAKVIVTENNSKANYYNGMQGIVKSVEKNVVTIVTTRGRRVKLHKKTIHINERETVLGYPLDLGYAITIHKSQGMTLEGANINPQCFDCGQLYVALSRVKSASGVHLLAPIRPEYIKVNQDALEFDKMMRMESERRTSMLAM